MNRTKAGRPRREEASIGREEILRAGLELLQSAGPQGLTMRALARSMKINPMTLYYHVGDRAQLLRALADQVYSGVVDSAEGDDGVRAKIERLLKAYHEAVMRHPLLSIGIFSTPEAFSPEAQRITKCLHSLLLEARMPRVSAKSWLSILVDFTHGSAIAFAMGAASAKKRSVSKIHAQEYARGLTILLEGMLPVQKPRRESLSR
jgi:AcrR family transcriptional regulator